MRERHAQGIVGRNLGVHWLRHQFFGGGEITRTKRGKRGGANGFGKIGLDVAEITFDNFNHVQRLLQRGLIVAVNKFKLRQKIERQTLIHRAAPLAGGVDGDGLGKVFSRVVSAPLIAGDHSVGLVCRREEAAWIGQRSFGEHQGLLGKISGRDEVALVSIVICDEA